MDRSALHRRPGESALRRFKNARRAQLRETRRDWAIAAALCVALIVSLPFLEGVAQLFAAAALGFSAAIAFVVWTVGDVHSLPFLWGALGERWTAEQLATLNPNVWTVQHDVEAKHGNWDHIVHGPSGVFLLDSKNLSRTSVVRDDELVSGRLRLRGVRFRAAAAELAESLGHRGRRPWVQPVVVIWGDFPQRHVEEAGVIYLAASQLTTWLEATSQDAA